MVTRGEAQAGEGSATALRDRASPTISIRRGLVAMGLCWQALVMGPDPGFWPTSHAGTWLVIPLGLTWVLWLVILVDYFLRRLPPTVREAAEVADVLLLVVAGLGLVLLAGSNGRMQVEWAAGATLVNLGVGLAGMLLPAVLSRPFIIVTVGVEILVVLSVSQASPSGLRDALLYPIYATAVGAAGAGSRSALLRAARRHQGALTELRGARVRAAAISRIRRDLSRQERLIHESVLNTLAAIASGGLLAGSPAIRKEAAESTVVLRALEHASTADLDAPLGNWLQDLRPSLERLQALQIEARVQLSARLEAAQDYGLSAEAYAGMLMAIREALSNIERHAGARHAEVRIAEVRFAEASGAGGHDGIQVTIGDDGMGFDPSGGALRFGISESIMRTMRDLGGTAAVETAAGRGTQVRLTAPSQRGERRSHWSRMLEQGDEQSLILPSGAIPMGNAAFARPVLAWFGVFVLLSVLVTVAAVPSPLLTIVAMAIVGGLGVGLWILSAGASLPAWFIALCAVAAPLAYRLQVQALGTAPPTHWEDWTSEALAAIWLVCTAVGPWWSVLVALGSWLLTQGDPLHELLQPGTAIILAGAVFARSVRHNNLAFAEAEMQRTEELAAVVAESQGLERMRSRHELLEDSHALSLLLGVAEGRLDPGDAHVQQDCAREERFIRAVMRLDPEADCVHRYAGQAAVHAHHLGLGMDISLADTAGWPEESCARFFAEVRGMLGVGEAGTVARLTAGREGDALVMRFVAGDGMEAIEVRHA